MSKLVRDAMTADPRTVKADDPVVEAARIMEEEDVGSVPVVAAEDRGSGQGSAHDDSGRVATKDVSPAYPDEPLDEALEQMAYRQVRRLPVIENDRVVGILAQADVVQEVKDKKAGQLIEEISESRA